MLSPKHTFAFYIVFNLSFVTLIHSLHPVYDGIMTKDDLQSYYGTVVSEDVSSFEIVDVWDITDDGNKQQIAEGHISNTGLEFRAFGEKYHAILHENPFLIRPGLHVERWGKEGKVSSKPMQQGCYFFGELLSHNNSVVAISKCSGLKGIISHGDSDLFILPLSANHSQVYKTRFRREATNLHIIHKRAVSGGSVDPYSQFCSTEATKDLVDPDTGLTKNQELQAAAQEQSPQGYIGQKFMELLIVADNQMRLHHKENLESYVMTLLNIVSRRFIDPTLGQNIRLYVVRFIVLESDEVGTPTDRFPQEGGFTVSNDGAQLLNNFCRWQEVLNPIDDTQTDHWDNAIFISRYNLFDPATGNDNLLGRAFTGGTCSRSSQCSVNEDDGLGTALVITHETGHTLNLNHDSDYDCPDGVNIMSGTRSAGASSFEWSLCSKINIRTFLRNPQSFCLDDDPLIEPVPVNILPGTTIDYHTQCKLAFGEGYSGVTYTDIRCSVLECMDSRGRIFINGVPVMEGTTCGDNEWCISGECVVNEGLPDPVDGSWSAWEGDFGPCSRSCGRGVQERRRFCNNPAPMYGGRGCPGDAVEYQVCNFQPCDRSQDDFRDEQCAATNNEPFNGQLYNWVAYITEQSGDGLCDHKCLAIGFFWANRSPFQFIDGTQCWDDENADSSIIKLCVAGACRGFGCDGTAGSSLVFDSCGMCGGNGSSCEKNEDSFTGGNSPGFITFLTLPVGSTYVRVTNTNTRYTYMTAKLNGIPVFSGDGSTVPANGRYSAGNVIIRYERDSLQETVMLQGPTTEAIELEAFLLLDPTVQYIGDVNVRPMITYAYFSPVTDTPTARWQVTEYTECSATCGGGTQTRGVKCVRDVSGAVQPVDTSGCSHIPVPMTLQTCNASPCPSAYTMEWRTSEWFSCSVTCGNGTQQRIATCFIVESGDSIDDSRCDANSKPSTERTCNDGPCPPSAPISCNGLSTDETGLITQLGPTPNGDKCTQVIVAPPGKDIVIRFNMINVDCSRGEAFTIHHLAPYAVTYRYCGYNPNAGEITIPYNIVLLEYKATKQGHGYDAIYTFTNSTRPQECYEVYTGLNGVIYSSNYPEEYPANFYCRAIIVVQPSDKIRLSFRGFRLEDGAPDGTCPNDYLQVVDYFPEGSNTATMRYCGKQEPFKWRSRSNIVMLIFSTNENQQYQGYRIKYKTIW